MGALFNAGEMKVRPGVYRRITKGGESAVAGAIDGIAAVTVQADWGPLGTVTVHDNAAGIKTVYGEGGTLKAAANLFAGGAGKVYIYRLGTGGTKGAVELTDSSESPKAIVALTQKYEGIRAFSVSVRSKLGDTSNRELVVYDGAKELEKIEFPAAGEDAAGELVKNINLFSHFFSAELKAAGLIADVTQKTAAGGTNPTVNNGNYSDAFTALEPYSINVITVDTNQSAVHILLHEFVKRIYATGKLSMGVVGEPVTVAFDTRLGHATGFNDEKMVYVGGGFEDGEGNRVEGYEAASLTAGIISATASNSSIVHKNISGAVKILEKLTDTQYADAIRGGMLMLDENGAGGVWFDSGINTLVSLREDQDEGWKKIKRLKVRYELMDRIDRTVAPVVGKINCNADGVANVIKLGSDVIDSMISEGKLLAGSITADPAKPQAGDSAWFLIDVSDLDVLEKIYLTYQFKFSSN